MYAEHAEKTKKSRENINLINNNMFFTTFFIFHSSALRILNLLCTQSAKKNWCGRKKTLNFFVVSVKNIIQHHHYDDYRWLSLTILSSPVCFFSFVFFFNFFVKFLFEAIAKGDAKGLYSQFFLLSLRLYEIIKYTYKYLNGLTLNWSYQNPERKKRLEFHARNIQHTIRMYFNIFSSRFCVFIYKMILMLFMIFFFVSLMCSKQRKIVSNLYKKWKYWVT